MTRLWRLFGFDTIKTERRSGYKTVSKTQGGNDLTLGRQCFSAEKHCHQQLTVIADPSVI